jgi:cytoplasmic iron level regulating protein YaaA (DUF328/UPF0246 family)
MKTLIVTASSKSKNDQNIHFESPNDIRFHDSISDEFRKQLFNSRKEVIKATGIEDGPDLTKIDDDFSKLEVLPAYLRYTGRTFSKISKEAWDKLNKKNQKIDVVILSAMYGLIRYNEPIRNYTIKQVDKMHAGIKFQGMWKKAGAKDWLYDYIIRNNFEQVNFVLSTSYSGIIEKDKLMMKLENEIGVKTEDNQFKQGGMKSMLLRGEYINDFLLNNL